MIGNSSLEIEYAVKTFLGFKFENSFELDKTCTEGNKFKLLSTGTELHEIINKSIRRCLI